MAQPDKDDFNLDDFQFSGVGLTPLPDFNEASPLEPSPLESSPLEPISAPSTEPVAKTDSPLSAEPEDKKAKKKAKKEKKVKEVAPKAEAAPRVKRESVFLQRLASTNPYTVLLGMTVLALLLAILFLVVEWGRYGFDTKATKWKQTGQVTESVTSVELHRLG